MAKLINLDVVCWVSPQEPHRFPAIAKDPSAHIPQRLQLVRRTLVGLHMLWDGLFLIAATILAVNGWNRGIIASWRGPIAMILATLAVQPFYVDFATWIVSRLRVSPETAVLAAYLMLWFSIDSILEIVLAMVIRGGVQTRPMFFDRAGGVIYGLFKATVIIILPLMAVSMPLKIPPPPPDRSGLALPSYSGVENAYLVPGFKAVATALLPVVGQFAVSTKEPSFKPVYDKPKVIEGEAPPEETKGAMRKEIEDILK